MGPKGHGIKHRKKRAFLAALAETGNVSQAASAARVTRWMHYHWLKDDPAYAEAARDAEEQAADKLEAEARRRALEGVVEDVYYAGEPVGKVRRYSDTLLMFLLNGYRPERFKQRGAVELTGGNGEPLRIVVENGFKVPGAVTGG